MTFEHAETPVIRDLVSRAYLDLSRVLNAVTLAYYPQWGTSHGTVLIEAEDPEQVVQMVDAAGLTPAWHKITLDAMDIWGHMANLSYQATSDRARGDEVCILSYGGMMTGLAMTLRTLADNMPSGVIMRAANVRADDDRHGRLWLN